MLHVRTEVKPSSIHGLGLFSEHKIKAGEIVWTFNPKIDQTFTPNFLETIPETVANQLRKYSYINPDEPDLLIVCGDDARFLNFPALKASVKHGGVTADHEPANLALAGKFNGEYRLVAARDIAAGEELTVPLESDADAGRKLFSSF